MFSIAVNGFLRELDVAVIDVSQVVIAHLSDVLKVNHKPYQLLLVQCQLTQKLELVLQNVVQGDRVAAGMASGEHNQATIVELASFGGDLDASGDPLGILLIVLYSSMLELYLLHQGASHLVKEGILTVVVWGQHQVLPQILKLMLLQYVIVLFKSFSE